MIHGEDGNRTEVSPRIFLIRARTVECVWGERVVQSYRNHVAHRLRNLYFETMFVMLICFDLVYVRC